MILRNMIVMVKEVIEKSDLIELLKEYATKEDLNQSMKHDALPDPNPTDDQIITHLKECKEPDCKIKQYKDQLEEDGLILGLMASGVL